MPDIVIKAVVQKIVVNGKHGSFAVATSDGLDGSITFSLEPTVWLEDDCPEEGLFVFLTKLRQKRAGWRAKQGRYWLPSDEQTERSKIMNEKQEEYIGPTFLYPKSRQFPFDEVCERIVRELEIRNWQVPGIEVKFDVYGSGEAKFRMVRCLKGKDFKLLFCRTQGKAGDHYSDVAAVTEMIIPKMHLRVYEDESGPSFYCYVGKNWERDRKSFMNRFKVNSKMDKKPRIYIQYTGGCVQPSNGGIQHTYGGRRSPYFVHNNDGREYAPKGKEPNYFVTGDIFSEFTKWLTENILNHILAQSIPCKKIDVFPTDDVIPFPKSVGHLFTFGEWKDKKRINQGRKDPSKLKKSDRYGLYGSGYRLVSLGVSNDGTFPELAFDGFEWCGIGEVTADTPIKDLEVPGHYRWSDRQQFIIRVTPSSANGIYVADMSAQDEYKQKLFEENPKQERMTDEQYNEFQRVSSRTLIPITEYKGDYKRPVVLINREMYFNEVEIVSGPHKERR